LTVMPTPGRCRSARRRRLGRVATGGRGSPGIGPSLTGRMATSPGWTRDTHTYGVCAVSRMDSGHDPGHSPRSFGTRPGREPGHTRDTRGIPVPLAHSGHVARSSGPLREAPDDVSRGAILDYPAFATHPL
jgi:hypothetical protein